LKAYGDAGKFGKQREEWTKLGLTRSKAGTFKISAAERYPA
jgi:hypothetical protein